MYQVTVTVEGMRCGMCEAHINDAVRAAFPVKKVSSSRKRGETVLLCEEPVCEENLRRCIEACGYPVQAIHTEKAGDLAGPKAGAEAGTEGAPPGASPSKKKRLFRKRA